MFRIDPRLKFYRALFCGHVKLKTMEIESLIQALSGFLAECPAEGLFDFNFKS